MEPTISCRDLFARLGDEQLLVIDCRVDADWERWNLQIPGALRMSLAELVDAAHVLPDDELIVLCGTDAAECRRAHRLLTLRGRTAVTLVDGLHGWVSQGYPTERPTSRARAWGASGGEVAMVAKNG